MSERPRAVDPFLLRRLGEETEARAATATAPSSDAEGAPKELLDDVGSAVADLEDALLAGSHDLAAHPEVAFEEHRSAAMLADLVEAQGIPVTRSAHGVETALRAEVGSAGGPTIAILSEYDALPGIGHACGHNVIAMAGVGAFLALARVQDRLPGRVVWLGTPAEEGGSARS